jgi:hypothetical protein
MRRVLAATLLFGGLCGVSSAADGKAVEAALAKWIGTAKDGWTPVAFAGLRSGMSAVEVGRQFPGADQLRGPFSKVRISGIAHVEQVQFDFLSKRPDGQKGLAHVILTLERGFGDDATNYDALVRALEGKFGPMRRGPSAVTKGFWMQRGRMAQLVHWGRGQDLQLSFDFPAGAAPAVAAVPAASVNALSSDAMCRAAEPLDARPILEAKAATMTGCIAAVKEKLKAERCVAGTASVPYRLQHWIAGRWSNGVRLVLSCR